MAESLSFPDLLLFVVLPYCAVIVAVIGTIERYRRHGYSCSSYSSQFLENRQQFWGGAAFHIGILLVLAGHLALMTMPGSVAALAASPRRLFVIEAIGLALGWLAGIGLLVLIIRRLVTPAVRRVTGTMDWLVHLMLFVQIAGGLAIALLYPWGSGWFASALTPYLWSLAGLQPDAGAVAAMPPLVKLHVANAFAILAIFPFTRLVHIVAVPLTYVWRRPQVVRWQHPRGVLVEKQP
jgi:nitrate reductase gamma subunit